MDIVLELGGAESLAQSLQAVRFSGGVQVIGVISGVKAEVNIAAILRKHVRIQGISVGSRDSFEALIRTYTEQELHPVIDRVFSFNEAKDAVAYLEAATTSAR